MDANSAIKLGLIPEGFTLDCAYVPSGADCDPNSPHCSKLVFVRDRKETKYLGPGRLVPPHGSGPDDV